MTNDRLISGNVGDQVKQLRKRRGWETVREFVDACAAAGWPVSPATINNIEGYRRIPKGGSDPLPRREVSVDELLALAYVLRVHPVDLLLPGDAAGDDVVELPPDIEVPADVARAWVGGTGFLEDPADEFELSEAVRAMPKHRQELMSRTWFTPERLAELTRQHNLREAAVNPDGIGGFWGQDGGYARSDGVSFSAEKVRELVELERERRAQRKKAPEGNEASGEK